MLTSHPEASSKFMVTATIPARGFLDREYESHMAFESQAEFEAWRAQNPEAKIMRTSKTHRNAWEPEEKARIEE